MQIKSDKKNQRLYISIFISLILCIVLSILIVSSILYINFQSIALDQVYSDNVKNLKQTSENVLVMADTAMTLSNQIYSDQNVAKLLYYSEPEIFDIRGASDQLTNYRLSFSFIDSVYVYNGKTGTFYINTSSNRNTTRETIQTKNSFDDKECIDILDNFNSYKQYIPIPRKYMVNNQEGIEKYYYSFLLYNAFSGSKLDSAVIVNFSENWIQNVMNVESSKNEGETFIINNKGTIVSNSDKYPMMSSINGTEYIKRILANENAQGYLVDIVNGEKSLITYTAADKMGWRYIRVTPWSVLFYRIESMKATTIYIGLSILIFGLLTSFLLTKKLYVPIDKIISRLKNLESESKHNSEIIKQGFLKDIIIGRDIEDENIFAERLKNLNIKIDAEGNIRVILLKIDRYNEFCQKYTAEDRGLFRFAIINICTELFSQNFRTEGVDMGEGNIIMLLNYINLADADVVTSFEGLINIMEDVILKNYDISLTVTISSEGCSLKDINTLYRQVMEASLHRLFLGQGSVIYADRVEEMNKKEYKFPVNSEKLLVDALMSQKNDEAKRIYDEIIGDTAEYPFSVINLVISHLIFTINNTINTIKINNSLLSDFNKSLPAMLINNVETIEEINKVFYELFDELRNRFDERKNMKHEETVNSINSIIDMGFSNPSLSVESIADSLDISPAYIGRLYKQYTMTTILDKIVKVRMEKAKELLLETKYSITHISEETGYTNSSYFYKTFKKFYGTTPNDFRRSRNNT